MDKEVRRQTGLAEARDREAHAKQVLPAVRNVNQLIVRESDPQHVIGGRAA